MLQLHESEVNFKFNKQENLKVLLYLVSKKKKKEKQRHRIEKGTAQKMVSFLSNYI